MKETQEEQDRKEKKKFRAEKQDNKLEDKRRKEKKANKKIHR